MAAAEFRDALQSTSELELTVTGRKSGNESTRPIWFVTDGDRLLLMPVGGKGANWYRNVAANPGIRLKADGAELPTTAQLVEDEAAVSKTVEQFAAKYGGDRVEQYYPHQDAAVEISLS